MNPCFKFLFPLLCVFTLSSCSNDLEVLADYKESAAIYGLLDPNLSMQFIKINKVFTNVNAKATDVAKIADSLYFDTIAPELVENGTGRRIPLYKANILLKDSGTFANAPNYLYVTNERIYSNQTYRIELRLPNTGTLVTAETNMVNTPFFQLPVNFGQRVFSVQPVGTIPVSFQSPQKGKIFDAFFYFNYIEVDKADTNIKTLKTIEWKILRSYRTLTDKGGEFVLQRIPGILFYDLLLSSIPKNNNVIRRFTECELALVSGNLELDTYIQASVPSIGIVQKQSDYSNITNGVGLLASRNTLYLNQITISDITKIILTTDDKYIPLGFVR